MPPLSLIPRGGLFYMLLGLTLTKDADLSQEDTIRSLLPWNAGQLSIPPKIAHLDHLN